MALLVVLLVAGILFLAAVVATREEDLLAEAPPDDLPVELPAGRLESEDLRSVRFSMALRGYRMDQVDGVLDRLGAELAERDARLADLERVLAEIVEPVVDEVESHQAVRVEVDAAPQPEPDPEPDPDPEPEPEPEPEPAAEAAAPAAGMAASLALGVPAADVPLPEQPPAQEPPSRPEALSPAASFSLPLPEPHGDPLVPEHSGVPHDEVPQPADEDELPPHGDALLHPGSPVDPPETIPQAHVAHEEPAAPEAAWWERLVPAAEEPAPQGDPLLPPPAELPQPHSPVPAEPSAPHGDPLVPRASVDDGLDFPDVQSAEPAEHGVPDAVDAEERREQ